MRQAVRQPLNLISAARGNWRKHEVPGARLRAQGLPEQTRGSQAEKHIWAHGRTIHSLIGRKGDTSSTCYVPKTAV